MNPSLYSIKRKFFNTPISHSTLNSNRDYDYIGAELCSYNTYRHFILPYITNPTEDKVIDVNCGLGYGLSYLKDEFNFKKCIGYNSDPNALEQCKNVHSNVSFYKDFIMSKQSGAKFVLAFDVLNLYSNKSALLLRLAHTLKDGGILVLVNRVEDPYEYANYEMVLERTHGLTKITTEDINTSVFNAVNDIHKKYSTVGAEYAQYQTDINLKNIHYIASVFRK